MVDVDTFLTTLCVTADDFCHSRPSKKRPGPEASLSRSEVLNLAIFARWSRFTSERDFYRYAHTKLRNAFPTLPDRSQFNRLVRSCTELIEAFALHLATLLLEVGRRPYQALDSSAMPVRDCKRRGHGWLAGYADIGWSNSLGWYEGFCLLTATDPTGVITGFCFGAASTADQQLAETFFAVRAQPNPKLISVGLICSGPYVADKGFEGVENHRRWQESYGAPIIHPPKRNSRKRNWPKRLRRWVAGIRQIVETVYDKLFNAFGLWRERPHSWKACEPAWRRGWPCTISVSGSTSNLVVLGWLSLICWSGDLNSHQAFKAGVSFHRKHDARYRCPSHLSWRTSENTGAARVGG